MTARSTTTGRGLAALLIATAALARGVVTQAQAEAIDAQIAAGELDAAYAAIGAARDAARTADDRG